MPSSIALSPYAFIGEADAIAYFFKGVTPNANQLDLLHDAINWATARMESRTGTGRKLKARTYAARKSFSCTVSTGNATLTAATAGFTSGADPVRVGDPVVGASSGIIAPYTSILSVGSDTVATMSANGAGNTSGVCTI